MIIMRPLLPSLLRKEKCAPLFSRQMKVLYVGKKKLDSFFWSGPDRVENMSGLSSREMEAPYQEKEESERLLRHVFRLWGGRRVYGPHFGGGGGTEEEEEMEEEPIYVMATPEPFSISFAGGGEMGWNYKVK